MRPVQVRIPKKMVDEVDKILKTGIHTSRSDVIRDAVRRFIMEYNNLTEAEIKKLTK